MTLSIDTKFEGKRHEKFGKFSPEHVQQSKNWDFDGILLDIGENVRT